MTQLTDPIIVSVGDWLLLIVLLIGQYCYWYSVDWWLLLNPRPSYCYWRPLTHCDWLTRTDPMVVNWPNPLLTHYYWPRRLTQYLLLTKDLLRQYWPIIGYWRPSWTDCIVNCGRNSRQLTPVIDNCYCVLVIEPIGPVVLLLLLDLGQTDSWLLDGPSPVTTQLTIVLNPDDRAQPSQLLDSPDQWRTVEPDPVEPSNDPTQPRPRQPDLIIGPMTLLMLIEPRQTQLLVLCDIGWTIVIVVLFIIIGIIIS